MFEGVHVPLGSVSDRLHGVMNYPNCCFKSFVSSMLIPSLTCALLTNALNNFFTVSPSPGRLTLLEKPPLEAKFWLYTTTCFLGFGKTSAVDLRVPCVFENSGGWGIQDLINLFN